MRGGELESQTNGWRCPSCQFPNRASDPQCFICHRPRAADPTGQKAPDAAMLGGLPSHGTHRMRLLAAIGSGALIVGVVGVLLLSSIGPQAPNGIAAATASPTQPEGQVADAPTGTPFPSDAPGTHTVQTWDTLYGIAQSLGVSEEQLRYWNYEKYPALRSAPRGLHAGWVLITDGPPLPTPTPRPTRQPTPAPTQPPAPTSPPAGGGPSSYEAALNWRAAVQDAYLGDLSYLVYEVATYACCGPGTTPEERAAVIEEAKLFYLDPAKAILNRHAAYLADHPAPACLRDAYAADRTVLDGYTSWLGGWNPFGVSTGEGRAQYLRSQELDRQRTDLIYSVNNLISDCY